MPLNLSGRFHTVEAVLFCVLAAAVPVTVLALRAWKRSRISPAEQERRRRAGLYARGKMGDANLLEFRDEHLFYSYDVRGIEYMASQDVSALKDRLPADPTAINGAIYVKYDARNPANSMVLSEQWSGLPSEGAARRRAGAAKMGN